MTYPPKLIAIHGLKGSGKDLTAKMLQSLAQHSATFAFGDRLKNICSTAWDLPINYFYDEKLKEKMLPLGMSPRDMMTRMQGPIKKSFGADFFAKCLYKAWSDAQEKKQTLIVTDLRFDSELAVCRALKANVLHLNRFKGGPYTDFSHESEAGLPMGQDDCLIQNNGTIEDLKVKVVSYVEYLWGPDALKPISLRIPPAP